MSFINIKNVSYQYDDHKVLNNISLSIKQGEFVSIIGKSGCGKTTLLNILSGLLSDYLGSITVNNKPLKEAINEKKFGLVFQNPILFPWRTVLQNIELPLELIDKKVSKGEIDKLLQLVELDKYKNFYPKALSGGMKQKVAMIRTLIYNPDVLLMDEPFGALDELTREYLDSELLKIWKQTGKTIIFITHSISEAVFLSTRVMTLSSQPANIIDIKNIELSYPRNEAIRQSDMFFKDTLWLRNQLRKS